jgi:hypothetical protein
VDPQAADVHSQDGVGVLAGLLPTRGHLDATELAAPADLHLGLDDAGIPDRVSRGDGLRDGLGRTP